MTTITLTSEIKAAVVDQARRQGTTPERLVLDSLREKFAADLAGSASTSLAPRDDWERMLDDAAVNAGVSLSDEQVGRESLYE